MEIRAELLSQNIQIEGHKGIFFVLSFYKHEQAELQAPLHQDGAQFEFEQVPLHISDESLEDFCTRFAGGAFGTSSGLSLLLNSYVNVEMYETVPLSELNPKDTKSTDLVVHYVAMECVPLYEFITQRSVAEVVLEFLDTPFHFEFEIVFEKEINLSGATIGRVMPTLTGFEVEYQVPGHRYMLSIDQGGIKYEQEMEFAEGKLIPTLKRMVPFADYKELADESEALAETFEQLFATGFNQSQANSKTPREKTRAPAAQFKVFEEPLEVALLERTICDNSEYRLIYQASDRESVERTVKLELTLKPDIRDKMEQTFRKPIEKPPFESPFYASFTYPEISGITRKALCSSGEIEEKDERLYSLYGTLELDGLDQMTSVSVGGECMLPSLDISVAVDSTSGVDKKAKKDPKADQYSAFADGSPNFVYLNEIMGIEKLLGRIAQPLPNSTPLSDQNPFIRKIMQEYAQDMRSQDRITALYIQLFKIISMQNILADSSTQLEIYPCLQLEFKFPIALRAVRMQPAEEEFAIELHTNTGHDNHEDADIHKTTIYYLNQLQDAYFVTAYNGCVNADEKVGNLAQQKALKKLQLNKQYNLRGIQGLQQQKTFIQTSKIKDDVDVNFEEFVHMIEADGMIDLLVRELQPVLRNHISMGFANRTDIVNYLVKLIQDQVTDEIFVELQEQKRERKEQREAEEKMALISMANDANSTPEGAKRDAPDSSNKKKMFKTIKLNNELSNALLKINAQMELEKRIKTEEKLLEIVEKVEYTADQLDLVERINTCLYFTAANNHNFAPFAYRYAQGLLARMLGTQVQPSRSEIQKLSEAMPDPIYTQNLLYSLLLSALQIAQPMIINEKEDFDRVVGYLKSVTALVLEIAEHQVELVNIDTAVLISCILISEEDWQAKVDKNSKIVQYMEELRDEYGPDDPSTDRNAYVPKTVVPPKLENLEVILMVKTILKKADHFLINFMVNFSLASAERYRPTEHKYEILGQLQEGKYRTQDIELIFEIIGLPDCAPRQYDNNTILAVEMTNLKDDAGKRIMKNDIEEAQTKDIEIRVQETPDYIIGSFLYILYKFEILSAKTISTCIFEALDALIEEYDSKFRKLVEKVEELDLTASNEALPKFVDSPKQQNEQSIPRTLPQLTKAGPTPQSVEPVQITQKPPTLEKNGSSFISVTSIKEKSELTQQIFARMKIIRSTIKMTKFQSEQHLAAVEEHILTQKPDFSKISATIDKFTDADAFMEHVLNSSLPRQERQSASLNASALLSLAEYLAIRSETHISDRIVKYVLGRIENDVTSQAQYEEMRAQFVQLRTLYTRREYDAVIKHADAIKQEQGAIASRARQCPALSYFKAAALMRYAETGELTKIQKANVLQEVFKHAYNAYIQTQKVKDFDEFFKGSTSIGEAAYYDFALAYNIAELMLYSINVTEVIANKQLSQDEMAYSELQSAASVKMLPNLQTSTAFLHQNIPLRFGTPGEPGSSDGGTLVLFEDLKTSKAKPLAVADFELKKEQLEQVKEASPERPHFTSEDERKPQQTYLDYVRSSATLHTDENFEKDRTKMLFVIVQAVKQLLESNPGFGPSWALLALLQATLRNNTEARLSSSVATVLAPQIVDCWAIWVSCEILNYGAELENAKWLTSEFQQQIISMGVQKSRVDFLWKFVIGLLESGQ